MNARLENAVNRLVVVLYKKEFYSTPTPDAVNSNYWNGVGMYETAYQKLRDTLVPQRGTCGDKGAEALRQLSNAYYRHYNDGDKVPTEVYKLVTDYIKENKV